MTFTARQVLTAAQLNDLDITTLTTSGDITVTASSGNSNIVWSGNTGPFGLEASPGGTLESALYYRTTPDAWSFENASGDDILTIDINDQRVGVLNDSPTTTFDVAGALLAKSISSSSDAVLELKASYSQLQLTDTDDSTFLHYSYSGGALRHRYNSYSANEFFTLDGANQRVGIGVTSLTAGYKLDVSDRSRISANGSNILTLKDTGATNTAGYIGFNSSNDTQLGYIGFGNNDDIHIYNGQSGGQIFFRSGNNWRAYFNSSGHFLPYVNGTYDLGSSTLQWEELHANGAVVAFYEYQDYVANRSVNSNVIIYNKTITTQGASRLIMQVVTGQFVKSTSVTNLQLRFYVDGSFLSTNGGMLDTDHIGYGQSAMREQMVTVGNTGTLSRGSHNVRVYASSYGSNTVTLNYQSAGRSSFLYVWEVCT